jgi:hypothetical protein
MSQKLSLLQSANSVSRALTADTLLDKARDGRRDRTRQRPQPALTSCSLFVLNKPAGIGASAMNFGDFEDGVILKTFRQVPHDFAGSQSA